MSYCLLRSDRSPWRECCEIGTHEHTIPMPSGGRSVDVDFCIADVVAALNAANIATTWSCCGHGVLPAMVGLVDGRTACITRDADTTNAEGLLVAAQSALWALDPELVMEDRGRRELAIKLRATLKESCSAREER